jgi:ATP phosphoribosyltransferase
MTRVALPKGRLLTETAALLEWAGWGLSGYQEKARLYRLSSDTVPGLTAKMLNERDIPVQVAVGNYDLGISSLDWVSELLAKYPDSALLKVRDLGYGEGALHLIGAGAAGGAVRIASEYPNLAEALALEMRLKRFSIFPLWGGAEVYPPENAELALVRGAVGQRRFDYGLESRREFRRYGACLIANRDSWEKCDLSGLVVQLERALGKSASSPSCRETSVVITGPLPQVGDRAADDVIRLALPDGHQQTPAVELLNRAGIGISDYPSKTGNRRPIIQMDGVTVKVIRPQDMPLQVASGNFDLALTGRDWVREHRYQFPPSPVEELADLKFGRVRLVAVVNGDVPAVDTSGLRRTREAGDRSLRVASEYVNISDKYARDNHLGRYRVIPTWGATEAFLPEDADLLIENTQTGSTIAKHGLKIIDTLAESSACLVGNREARMSQDKRTHLEALVNRLRRAVEA